MRWLRAGASLWLAGEALVVAAFVLAMLAWAFSTGGPELVAPALLAGAAVVCATFVAASLSLWHQGASVMRALALSVSGAFNLGYGIVLAADEQLVASMFLATGLCCSVSVRRLRGG